MRRLALLLSLASTLSLSPLFGAYTYYVTDPLNNLNNSAPNFDINGSSTNNTGSGLTASTAGGGSFISRPATPDGSSQVEVAATLKLANSGGNYVIYLGATPNALLGSTSTGSFYAFAINNPTFANGGCTANLVLYRVVNGSVTQIGSTVIPCSDGVVYQSVLGNDNALRFWVNNVEYFYWLDSQPLQGKGGVGGYSMPTGNGISLIRIGACDRIAPTAVDPASIQNYALSNRVDLRTAGSADDVNGSGVNVYNWFRNGAYVTSTRAPEFSDVNVTPGTTNNYAVQVQDHHGNGTGLVSFSIPVPSTAVLDARQVGVRPTGSYWGGMGEQIDMRSGNLNFTYPLMAAQSRGWSMPLTLNYNSQNWRLDASGAPWRLGYDVGFGFGWKLQIGSLTPFYSTYTSVQFYEYSDPSGATYRLDQNNNGLWTSRESVYVTYDSNTQRLRFNNGSFWVLGCTSAGTEQDAGTMYPTLIEDSNGNQITVEYAAGIGVTWLNSSARLRSVRDVRPGTNPTSSPTYSFTYNNDAIPHLTAIANAINSQDSFAFSYGAPLTLASPFGTAQNFGTVGALATVQNNATDLTTSFDYDAASSGELLQVTFPLGGHIRWEFASVPYAQTTVREVNARYLQWDANIGERSFAFTRTPAGSNTFTANRKVVDSQAQAYKNWDFEPSSLATLSLVNDYSEGATGSQQTLRTTRYNWTQDPGGNLYIGRLQVTHNPGQSYAITKQVDQTADAYGNIVQTKLYDFGDLSTPSRTYNTSYLTSANGNNYTDLYIRDRAATTTVTDRNNVTTTLKQNTYDQYPAGITPTANIQ